METRRLLVAALLSLAILVGWQTLFPPPPLADDPAPSAAGGATMETSGDPGSQAHPGEGEAVLSEASASPILESGGESATEAADGSNSEPTVVGDPIGGVAGEQVELATDSWRAIFDSTGARLLSMTLMDRRGADGEPVELVRERSPEQPFPFSFVDRAGHPLELDRAPFAVEEQTAERVVFRFRGAAGDATKTFLVGADGLLDFQVSVTAPREWALWFGPGVSNPAWKDFDNRFSKTARQATLMREELESRQTGKLEGVEVSSGSGVSWFSLEDKYFLVAVAPTEPIASVAMVPARALGDEDRGIVGYVLATDDPEAAGPLDAGLVVSPQTAEMAGVSYWGAKEYTRLQSLPYGFEQTVRFGMFGVIARPLLYGLRWIHSTVTPNWGWSIVLMTLAINLVLFPLRHKSFISMQKMQKLNPRMEAIRAKFRPKLKDKQGKPNLDMQRKMNEEIQGLFKQEGVNPAMGCLPLLVQMPVFFAFYRLLGQAVELQGAPWIGWITDLSVQDPYKALPLLMGATQFLQTKTMPPATNPTQRILMNTMPIWFTFFAFAFPAGLVLYWLTNNTLTIIQQAGYNQLKKAGYLGGVVAPPSPPGSKGSKKPKKGSKG